MKPTTLAVAMHEAGHAVVQLAIAPSQWIEAITLRGLPEGHLGYVETDSLWQSYMKEVLPPQEVVDQWRKLAWKDILIFLAGPIAELKWNRYSRDAVLLTGHFLLERCLGDAEPCRGMDLWQVRTRLLWRDIASAKDDCLEAWSESNSIVSQKWTAIRSVGRELAAKGRLSNPELIEAWRSGPIKDQKVASAIQT